MRGTIFKRLIKEKKNDIVHSSAYGKVQNGGGMGAASSLSFEKRMEINQHRKMVRGYGDSRIASGIYNSREKAKVFEVQKGIDNKNVKQGKDAERFVDRNRREEGDRRHNAASDDKQQKRCGYGVVNTDNSVLRPKQRVAMKNTISPSIKPKFGR